MKIAPIGAAFAATSRGSKTEDQDQSLPYQKFIPQETSAGLKIRRFGTKAPPALLFAHCLAIFALSCGRKRFGAGAPYVGRNSFRHPLRHRREGVGAKAPPTKPFGSSLPMIGDWDAVRQPAVALREPVAQGGERTIDAGSAASPATSDRPEDRKVRSRSPPAGKPRFISTSLCLSSERL